MTMSLWIWLAVLGSFAVLALLVILAGRSHP